MARTPPSYDKDGMADNLSERTYNNDNTAYNIELNRLRSHLPDAQATRPRSVEYEYNPRHDNINNAPAEKSSKGTKRAERVFATMCCGSWLCALLWIIVSLLVIAAFTVLLVKVSVRSSSQLCLRCLTRLASSFHCSPSGQWNINPALEPSTITVTQSTASIPISTTTAISTTTDITTSISVSTLTTVSVTTQTYTPPSPTTFTITSVEDGTTVISVETSGTTTTESPIPTSIVTTTEVSISSISVTTTATSSVTTTTTSGTTATSTLTTATHDSDDHNDNDHDNDDGKSEP